MTQLNGRPVGHIILAGVDRRDHPDYADAYVASAVWNDTGEELSDEELEELSSDGELIGELVEEHLQGEADRLYDRLMDR